MSLTVSPSVELDAPFASPPAAPTGPAEPLHRLSLIARCQRCDKPIVTYGYCYTCATGRKRTLLRPEERTPSASATTASSVAA